MELRLFRALCLVAALLTLCVVVPVDYLIQLSPAVRYADLGVGMVTLLFFSESYRGRYWIKSLFIIYLLSLNLCWMFNNGSYGTICLFFFNVFIYALIFFRGKLRWILLGAGLGDVLCLIATEPFLSQWHMPYHSQSDRLLDLAVSLTVNAISCSLMIWAVLTSHDREQRRLSTLNADLERNIAERVEAEQSLRQNRELLHAVIEGSTDAVYAKDTSGRYILFNGAAAALTGKSPGEVLGRDDSFLFPWAEARVIMGWDCEVLSTGEVRNLEHTVTNALQEQVVLQTTKGPLRDERGAVIGVFGISRDITAARRVDEEIRLLNAELDQRVTERSVRLEAAIKEQESFSYSISHDLRAPLRHINSYSALLTEECAACLTPEAGNYLERIRFSSRSMGKLIDDLLELSRIGRSPMLKSPVSLSELAEGICFRLQQTAPERRVEVKIAPDLIAQGDPIMLQQTLENLLDNAWKYSAPREAACIELGTARIGEQEVFFVRDNGVGFDMAYQDKLFGAFQRLHGAEFEGTGIGLAMVKRIIGRHGGKVWAEGEVNKGATIYFTLPGKTGG
jgi:PAS domain S-box-containing protein